jgi:hypothetical protein
MAYSWHCVRIDTGIMRQNRHFFGTVGAVYCVFLAVLIPLHSQVHSELGQPPIHIDSSVGFHYHPAALFSHV